MAFMKTKIKLLPALLLMIFMVACASVAVPETEEIPAPIPTENIVALTKVPMMTGEAETETAVSPRSDHCD